MNYEHEEGEEKKEEVGVIRTEKTGKEEYERKKEERNRGT